MRYKDANTPQEYLRDVLDNWTAFCEVNSGLAKAIEKLLEINDALVDAVNVLANELNTKKSLPEGNDPTTKR